MLQITHSRTSKVSGWISALSASCYSECNHEFKGKNVFESQKSVTRSRSVSLNNTLGWSSASKSKYYSEWNHEYKVKNVFQSQKSVKLSGWSLPNKTSR